MINVWNKIMDTRKVINREEVLVAARFYGPQERVYKANEMRKRSLRQLGRTRQAGRPDTETKTRRDLQLRT